MMERFATLLMSQFGPKPKCLSVRYLVAVGVKADIAGTPRKCSS
jgi:hypothetical protein